MLLLVCVESNTWWTFFIIHNENLIRLTIDWPKLNCKHEKNVNSNKCNGFGAETGKKISACVYSTPNGVRQANVRL